MKRRDGGAFCFSLSCAHDFPRNFKKIDVKNCLCYCKKQVDNYFPWSILWSGTEMKSKCSDLFSETRLSCDSWFWLNFWTFWRHFYGRFNKYGFHLVVRLFKIDHRWPQNVVKTKIKVALDIMISSFAIGMNFTWQWRHNCFRSKLLSTRCEMSNARSPACARKYALKGNNLFISTSVMPSFLAKFIPPWETFVSVMQRIKECNWEGAEEVGPITFGTLILC